MKKPKTNHVDRRKFIQYLTTSGAALLSPSHVLLQSLLSGGKAIAQSANAPIKRHFQINLFGAPANWNWNLLLRPNGNDPTIPFNMAHSRLTGVVNGFPTFEYATLPLGFGRTYHFPNLWASPLPTPTGTVPMRELLRNYATINLGGNDIDGHTVNDARLVRPGGNGPTLQGVIADVSTRSFPALSLDAVGATSASQFKSVTGRSNVSLYPFGANNPVGQLLFPFDPGLRHPYRGIASVDAAVELALGQIDNHLKGRQPALDSIFFNRRSADQLVRDNAANLQAAYPAAFAKYQSLVERSLRTLDIPGLTSNVIPGMPSFPITVPGTHSSLLSVPQIAQYRADGFLVGVGSNVDLRQALVNADVVGLAAEFATAELALPTLTSSMIAVPQGMVSNAVFPNCVPLTSITATQNTNGTTTFNCSAVPSTQAIGIAFDGHAVGAIATALFHSGVYRAVSACLYELIQILKANNLFDTTLIQVCQEFVRSPLTSAGGSDHGFRGGTTTLLNGRIDGTYVNGNIWDRAQEAVNSYAGTWGEGAPHPEIGNQVIRTGNILSSICGCFGIPSISINTPPVFSVNPNTGKMQFLINGSQVVPRV